MAKKRRRLWIWWLPGLLVVLAAAILLVPKFLNRYQTDGELPLAGGRVVGVNALSPFGSPVTSSW